MWPTTCDMQRASCNMQQTTRNGHRQNAMCRLPRLRVHIQPAVPCSSTSLRSVRPLLRLQRHSCVAACSMEFTRCIALVASSRCCVPLRPPAPFPDASRWRTRRIASARADHPPIIAHQPTRPILVGTVAPPLRLRTHCPSPTHRWCGTRVLRSSSRRATSRLFTGGPSRSRRSATCRRRRPTSGPCCNQSRGMPRRVAP